MFDGEIVKKKFPLKKILDLENFHQKGPRKSPRKSPRKNPESMNIRTTFQTTFRTTLICLRHSVHF